MKRAILVMAGLVMIGSMGWADEAKPAPSTSAYLDQLQVKLEHTAQRVNQPSGTGSAVVGLRGSQQTPLSKQLYWKGKDGTKPVSPDEVKLFRGAIEDAKAGKQDVAIASLKSFLDKYPNSALKGDAQETLKQLMPVTAMATPPAIAPAAAVPAKP